MHYLCNRFQRELRQFSQNQLMDKSVEFMVLTAVHNDAYWRERSQGIVQKMAVTGKKKPQSRTTTTVSSHPVMSGGFKQLTSDFRPGITQPNSAVEYPFFGCAVALIQAEVTFTLKLQRFTRLGGFQAHLCHALFNHQGFRIDC